MDHNRLPCAHTDSGERVEDILLKHDLPIHYRFPSIPAHQFLLRHAPKWHTGYAAHDAANDTFPNVAEGSLFST